MRSPLHDITEDWMQQKSIRLFLKRDDLLNPLNQKGAVLYSGNKWRKLKYNLPPFLAEPEKPILSFGGAFSNHLYALGTIASHFQLSAIGIVRGEANAQKNPTLSHCLEQGMQLHFVSREEYRRRNDPVYLNELKHQFGEFHLLPEGGSNTRALTGCIELVQEVREVVDFSHICAAVGTGSTLAGIILGLQPSEEAMGVAALKGNFLQKEVADFLGDTSNTNWSINNDYHFGGYARHKPPLLDFMRSFYQTHQVKLDPVYTSKMLFAVYDLIRNDHFKEGNTIVAVHTGGLQGLAGFRNQTGISLYE